MIVAGGGPAGCVVAGRLARADEKLQVLLMDAGANNIDGEQNELGFWVTVWMLM